MVEAGQYLVRLENSSASTQVVAGIQVEEDLVVRRLENCLSLSADAWENLEFLFRGTPAAEPLPQGCPVISLTREEVAPEGAPSVPVVDCSSLSDRQLACPLCG